MKRWIFVFIVGVGIVSQAGLVAWQTTNVSADPLGTTIQAGWAVELFQDVNNDNVAWQGDGGLWLNNSGSSLVIDATSGGNTIDDVMLGIFTTSRNIGNFLVGINSVGSVTVTNNIQVYSVMYNNAVKENATQWIVLDSVTFNTGSVVAPGAPLTYDATPGGDIASPHWLGVPEPGTFGLMMMSGAGLFLIRGRKRSMNRLKKLSNNVVSSDQDF